MYVRHALFWTTQQICPSHFALASCLPCHPTPPSLGEILLPGECFSNTSQPIQSSHSPPPPLSGSHTLSHCPQALITPQLDTRQPGTACAPEPLKLFKLGDARPIYPASPVPSKETTVLPCVAPMVQNDPSSWEL